MVADVRDEGMDQSVAVERVADLLSVPIKTLYQWVIQWVNQAESQTVSQAPAFDAEGNRCRRRGCCRGLGMLLVQRGELGESEALGRLAAGGGNTAAEAGDAPRATGLGLLLEQRGDLANAETWWRRAAEAGDTATAAGLAVPLERRGELDEAVRWYRTAAEAGNMAAAAGLGSLLEQRDDALVKLIDRLPRLVNVMDDDRCRYWTVSTRVARTSTNCWTAFLISTGWPTAFLRSSAVARECP